MANSTNHKGFFPGLLAGIIIGLFGVVLTGKIFKPKIIPVNSACDDYQVQMAACSKDSSDPQIQMACANI